MLGGPKVADRAAIELASVTDDIGTYTRPFGTGDLMCAIEGQTPAGSFDAYCNTLDEQETIFEMLMDALSMRAWAD